MLLFCAVVGAGAATEPAQAQAQPASQVQLGVAGAPSVGLQFGFIPQRRFYNIETISHASYRPPFFGGDHNLYFSAGFGASLRIMGVVDFVRDDPTPYDVDVGLRLGPGLQFKPNETLADRNRRFFLFLEPFVRYAFQMEGGQILFAELGAQQPFLRVGIWLSL